MVYSNDIYGLEEKKQQTPLTQNQFNSKYLKQFQTQDKIFNVQSNPYLDTDNST